MNAASAGVSETQTAIAPIELTESETDRIAGGAPTGDPGNAYGAPRHNRLDTGLGRDNTGHLSCCPGSAEGGGVVPPFPFQRIEGERHRQAERKKPRPCSGWPGLSWVDLGVS